MGEIGLTPAVFWRLTFWEWLRVAAGYRTRMTEHWRMMRELACLTYNINVERKDRIKPEEYMPLPGDEAKKPKAEGFIPASVFIQMLNETFGNLAGQPDN